MEWQPYLTLLLTSSLISAFVSGLISLYTKRIDFKNEYYKTIIKKRLETYEQIEVLIANLKSSILDDDGFPYHSVFLLQNENYPNFQRLVLEINAYNLWVDENSLEPLGELKNLFIKINFDLNPNHTQSDLVKIGKSYYKQIAEIRDEIERTARQDILNLHKFKNIRKKVNLTKYRTI